MATARSKKGASESESERSIRLLLLAAENDDPESLQQILEIAKDDGQRENFLCIGLMRSSEKGKIISTTFLLSRGAAPDGVPGNNLSPLLRAVEGDHVAIVQLLLEHGANPETADKTGRTALMAAASKNHWHILNLLIEKGADVHATDKTGRTALVASALKNHPHIVNLLIATGADINAADKKGRTALMTAAWKNQWHILNLLISKGADINATDLRKRNVLHNLAADKQCDWGASVMDLLLKEDIHIDGQDELRRTPLHWACATGKKDLVERFLTRTRVPRANIKAVEIREKTVLHMAATHGRDEIVEILLKHGSDLHARSDGGWTPLHSACDKGSKTIVEILLQAGADINAKLLNGMSPLHLAAQGGHLEIVRCLLERKDIKRVTRDVFGSTPFRRAAQKGRADIVNLLAPFNNVQALSEDAVGACNGFNATIVDFGNFHNENQVKRRTVFELLYARDHVDNQKPAVSILPKHNKGTKFRWIHLPANNMAWVEALLTKVFTEEGATDIESFKALERSFSHQHRGQQSHSYFMRPLCQSTPRASRLPDDSSMNSSTELTGSGISSGPKSKDDGTDKTPVKGAISGEQKSDRFNGSPNHGGKDRSKVQSKVTGKKSNMKDSISSKSGTEGLSKDQERKPSLMQNGRYQRASSSSFRNMLSQPAKGNIFTFMPYLHFETEQRRKEMEEAIKRAETQQSSRRPLLAKASTYDEMLIRAHLATSTVSLHVRRTLDQSFYHNIDTWSRDRDQVIYRYQTKGKSVENLSSDPKIIMVDQLWMWILGKDLIVTSFPQRWQQPKNDPLNVLDSVIEDINSKTHDRVESVYDLAMVITNRCSGVFDRHRLGHEEYQFLDMFESSLGSATDMEASLFKEFHAASAQASAWLQNKQRRPNRLGREVDAGNVEFEGTMYGPLFVDKLLDIGQETNLLAETKDIKDELNMISKVLVDQRQVLPDLEAAICDIYREEGRSLSDVRKRFKEQLKSIEMHIKDIERMDKQAEHIYSSVTDMLDLKQKHANAFEARFARDQAAGTARQSQTIMVFTIVTIIFLPLSFIAAVFTINIREFQHEGGASGLPLAYVSKYMFGIGFAISIPLIVIALSLENLRHFYVDTQSRIRQRRFQRQNRHKDAADFGDHGLAATGLDLLKTEQLLSMRRSVSRDSKVTTVPEVLVDQIELTGFRMRGSADVERGGL